MHSETERDQYNSRRWYTAQHMAAWFSFTDTLVSGINILHHLTIKNKKKIHYKRQVACNSCDETLTFL